MAVAVVGDGVARNDFALESDLKDLAETRDGLVHGAIPADGIAASLQAKVGRRYQTFRTVRVLPGRRGRFRTAYRFRRTSATIRYRFRVVVLKQAGLPFESGHSRVQTVTVRP